MFEDGFDKRVGLKRSAHLFKVRCRLFAVTIDAEARLAVEVELFAGIVIDHPIEFDYRVTPRLDGLADLRKGHFADRTTPHLLEFVERPGPLVRVVVRVHLLHACLDCFEAHLSGFDGIQHLCHFATRSDETSHIDPVSQAGLAVGLQSRTYLINRLPLLLLQPADEAVSEEFLDADGIEFASVLEGRVTDLTVPVTIDLSVRAAERLQLVENLASAPHLLNRIRAQEVKIDLVELVRILAVVTLRPFLRVTDRTYGTQVRAGHQVRLGVVLYEIRERQIGGVGMVGVTSHNEGESPHFGRPEQITVAGRFRAALGDTLVNRTEFVHVVRLVRTRTGVQEREHTGNQQS